MIKVEGLCRNYGNFTAVNNVSFNINQGEIVGLLGHNGAGKTTIMKMLTGFLEPSSGSIQIAGLNMPEQRSEIQQKIGYLPENCPVYPEMNIIAYLEYIADLRGLTGQSRIEAVRKAIARTELSGKAFQSISTLSRGYRQRVGVAQAILCKPEILILDEPTNGLDPTQIQHMRELITSLGELSTIIISTHILHEVQAICDRVLIIRDAELALDANLKDLQNSRQLLLQCNAAPDRLRSALNDCAPISAIGESSHSGGNYNYQLKLTENSDQFNAVPAVIKNLSANGVAIYSITPEQQDLETVFRKINNPATLSKGGELNAA